VSNNESEQRHFTHLIRCQTMKFLLFKITSLGQWLSYLYFRAWIISFYILFIYFSFHFFLSFFFRFIFYTFNQVSNNESEQRHFTHLIRCQTMKVKPYIILNTSRKHVNYEEVPMNKPYNIQNTNIYKMYMLCDFFLKYFILNTCTKLLCITCTTICYNKIFILLICQ
jgi:hypothetical protein